MPTTGTAFNAVGKAVSTEVFKKRNASCILGTTSASSTGNVSQVLTLANSCQRGGVKGGLPYESGVGHVKALSGGSFAYQSASTKWVMLGNNVTTTLSGASNTVLKSGAGDFFRRAIAWTTSPYISFLTASAWSASELEGPVYTSTQSATHQSMGNDIAAQLSRTSRSAIFYMAGKLTATKTNYSSLTLW